jgi:hypothetical protein
MTALLQRVFLVCSVILTIDVAFFGPGLILAGAGTSLRRSMFAVIFAVAILLRLGAPRPFSRNEAALLAVAVLLTVLWGVAVPASYGYSSRQGGRGLRATAALERPGAATHHSFNSCRAEHQHAVP